MAKTLVGNLAPLSGLDIDVIAYESAGTDVASIAQEITTALLQASAKPKIFVPFGDGSIVRGILIRIEEGSGLETKRDVLVNALQDAGLVAGPWGNFPKGEPPASSYNGPGSATAKLRILIGAKP